MRWRAEKSDQIRDSIGKHFFKNQNENQLNTHDESVLMRLNRRFAFVSFLHRAISGNFARCSRRKLNRSSKLSRSLSLLNNWTVLLVGLND